MTNVQLQLTVVICALLFACHGLGEDPIDEGANSQNTSLRLWTNKSGSKSREAEFLRSENGIAYFRNQDGTHVKCEVRGLSDADRHFLNQLAEQEDQLKFVAYNLAPVVVSGTVSSNANGTGINGVTVRAVNEKTGKTIPDANDTTKIVAGNAGVYSLTIDGLTDTDTVVIDFIPPRGHSVAFDKLLKGDKVQEINKVLLAGPGGSRSVQSAAALADGVAQPAEAAEGSADAAQKSPVQKLDQRPNIPPPAAEENGDDGVPELSINQALQETLDKLYTFEQIHTRLMMIEQEEMDEFDIKLQAVVKDFIQEMDRPQLYAHNRSEDSGYSNALYGVVRSKYDAVASLYGIEEERVYVPQSQPIRQQHRGIFPLFRGRR